MANPRKFSDKLEIIRRKEEEANAAFVKIMREVSDARTKTPGQTGHMPPPATWGRSPELMNMKQRFKGGSLPNVNMSQNPMAMQGMYPPGMPDIYTNRHGPLPQQGHRYMNVGQAHMRRMEPPSGPIFPSKNKRSYTVHASSPYQNNIHHSHSPNNLLPDQGNDSGSMWRRTFSDSAIHQTLQQHPKKNIEGSPLQNNSSGPRVINTAPIPIEGNESLASPQFVGSPPVSMAYANDTTNNTKNMQMQANTSSLPDLSNLSIPSPIHAPIDAEQENSAANSPNQNNHVSPEQPQFHVPSYRNPGRRPVGKQIYPRQIGSNPDVLESLHREQKLNLNFANHDKQDNISINTSTANQSAPLSPVTPPPFYWNSTPMSPLATSDLIQQQQQQNSPQAELQQQMSQFQIHGGENVNNGMGNPPPYPYINENETSNNFNYPFQKQSLYRINSGPAQFNSRSNHGDESKQMCDRQLDSELQKIRQQDNANSELSEADLNSVRVDLDPLDFGDVQILSGDNSQLVDQGAEESFRLERAGYQ
ncbi:CREB-regulated transcription coactivator 3-like [Clytia hemisphaerica]|uniref:Transducer of regulated CREB activity N-terminal domain-containing protein n=1 Tax=Clytia hemisphaerica TaxID=252671 RepID=A0A7M5X8B9_9CNID